MSQLPGRSGDHEIAMVCPARRISVTAMRRRAGSKIVSAAELPRASTRK
jgi:hypothetical protein